MKIRERQKRKDEGGEGRGEVVKFMVRNKCILQCATKECPYITANDFNLFNQIFNKT